MVSENCGVGGWTHIAFERHSSQTEIHTWGVVWGVPCHRRIVVDEDGKFVQEYWTPADQLRLCGEGP